MTEGLSHAVRALAGLGRRRVYRRGDALYRQGDRAVSFFLVLSGMARVSMVGQDGTEVVLENMGPETICGEGAAFDGSPRFSSAFAAEETAAIEVPTAGLESAFARVPALALALLRVASLKQRILAIKIQRLASPDPSERILELLERVDTASGGDGARVRRMPAGLSHAQVAAMTGLSRVTVTRTLGRLRRQGVLDGSPAGSAATRRSNRPSK